MVTTFLPRDGRNVAAVWGHLLQRVAEMESQHFCNERKCCGCFERAFGKLCEHRLQRACMNFYEISVAQQSGHTAFLPTRGRNVVTAFLPRAGRNVVAVLSETLVSSASIDYDMYA